MSTLLKATHGSAVVKVDGKVSPIADFGEWSNTAVRARERAAQPAPAARPGLRAPIL